MKRLHLMLGCVCLLCGCPSGSSSNPRGRCQTVITTACTRIASCAEKADLLDEDYPASELRSDCETEIGAELDCSHAEGVSEDYDDCLADLRAQDCDESNDALRRDKLPPPPDSCNDVILLSE